MKVKEILSLSLILFIFWLGLTASLEPQELIVGAVISLFAAYFSTQVLLGRGMSWGEGFPPTFRGVLFTFYYFPIYLWYEIKAHLQVIYIILHPRLPMKPGIVKVPTDLDNNYRITGLANSITMTPGTLTVDIDEDEALLYVHWIEVEARDPYEIREALAVPFEKYLRRIHE